MQAIGKLVSILRKFHHMCGDLIAGLSGLLLQIRKLFDGFASLASLFKGQKAHDLYDQGSQATRDREDLCLLRSCLYCSVFRGFLKFQLVFQEEAHENIEAPPTRKKNPFRKSQKTT